MARFTHDLIAEELFDSAAALSNILGPANAQALVAFFLGAPVTNDQFRDLNHALRAKATAMKAVFGSAWRYIQNEPMNAWNKQKTGSKPAPVSKKAKR